MWRQHHKLIKERESLQLRRSHNGVGASFFCLLFYKKCRFLGVMVICIYKEAVMEDFAQTVKRFLDNLNVLDEGQLKAIAHLIEVELRERDFMSNPQNWRDEDEH
jgi:hypothetical protein